MNKAAWAAWAVKNSVVLVCFTCLAIYFGKWWIVFFAALFLSSLKLVNTRRTCDGCGKTLFSSADNMDETAQRAGWVRKKNGEEWEDFCPECQKRGIGE